MSDAAVPRDRRQVRHAARRAAIVDAAWDLARENGLDGISLRTLADRVGLRQPSLYQYFASKDALFDAMFADGNRKLLDRMHDLDLPAEPVTAVKMFSTELAAFCVEDPVRYQLMFQRNVPGFVPSAGSYRLAVGVYDWGAAVLRAAGIVRQDDIDLFTAFHAGLVEQQLANEPGGQRWIRQLDRMIDLLLSAASSSTKPARRRPSAVKKR